jgi:hypothetical protein
MRSVLQIIFKAEAVIKMLIEYTVGELNVLLLYEEIDLMLIKRLD